MKRFRKPLIGVIGITAFSLLAFIGSRGQEADTSLTSMFIAGEADAECVPFKEYSAHGICLELTGTCVFDTSEEGCDPYGRPGGPMD